MFWQRRKSEFEGFVNFGRGLDALEHYVRNQRNQAPGPYSSLTTEEFLFKVDEYFASKNMPDYAIRAVGRNNDYKRHIVAEFKE